MIQCYEIQDAIDQLKSSLSDKCKVVNPKQVFYIMELIDAIRRCIEEEGEGNENAVLYIPQDKSDSERRIARENIKAVSREEMIQYIIDNSTYLAEQLGYEVIVNKQNNLNPDGTGTKYPTVDAVVQAVNDINDKIDNIETDKTYVHEQMAASNIWDFPHPLEKIPSVTTLDSAGSTIMGKVTIMGNDRIVVEFNHPMWGKAILN